MRNTMYFIRTLSTSVSAWSEEEPTGKRLTWSERLCWKSSGIESAKAASDEGVMDVGVGIYLNGVVVVEYPWAWLLQEARFMQVGNGSPWNTT